MRKIILLFIIFMPLFVSAQEQGWSKEFTAKKAFIENKGQFKFMKPIDMNSEIKYAFDGQNEEFYFTKSGVVFEFMQKVKKIKDEEELEREEREEKEIREKMREGKLSAEEWQEFEKEEHKMNIKLDGLTCQWIGSNPDVQIIAENKNTYTHSYSYYIDQEGNTDYVNNVSSYKKLIYKDLYPNIDVIYELHIDGGIKYSVLVHPGGNIADVKLKYSKPVNLKNDGTLNTNTSFGVIIDHAPLTFYENNKNETVTSSYALSNNIVSFNIPSYDHSKTLIIDPWVQTPAVSAPSGVWEVEVDGASNVYVIGGGTPMQLVKYNSAGVFQWIYNTPYDTNNGDWLGALATDNAGNSYVTRGSGASISKINPGGGVIYTTNGGGVNEYWQIAFNCDQTKLLVGGTGGLLNPFIFDINPNNGNVNNSITVGGTNGALNPLEVRAITSSYNARYYFLTHDSLGAFDQNLGSACPDPKPLLNIDHTYHFAYKCEDFRPNNGNGPISAIVADSNFLYTQNGSVVHKRDLNTGAILNSANIPNGITVGPVAITNAYQAGNSGIAIDNCGNVYVGSSDQIVKYDANLNLLTSTNVIYRVSDIEVSPGGEIVLCGTTNSSNDPSRTGYVQSLNMSACNPFPLVCCDATFCPIDPLCISNSPVTLTANTTGGTWSSSPATSGLNATTGVFDPSVAGAGTYTITYSMSCGSSSFDVIVGTCAPMDVCIESNGDLTVSGGDGPYLWDYWELGSSTPITNQTECTACGNTWNALLSQCGFPIPITTCNVPSQWTNFGTGTTVTPPGGSDTIQVTDNIGQSFVINGLSTLSPCSTTCDATITQAGPYCSNATSVNLTAAETGGTWSGTGITNASAGTFNPATAGVGSHVITYNLTCGDTDTMTIVVNAGDDANFTYPSGSYCLTDPNPTPSTPVTLGGVFTINGTGVINSSTGVINIGSSGIGNYVVTYTTSGSCPDTATFNVAITNSTNATITQAGPFCSNAASVNLTAVSPGGTWTGTGITNGTTGTFNPATAGVGSHVITYTISGSCGSVDTMTIVVNAIQSAAFSYPSGSYCLTDPNPTPTITGATGGVFTINNSGVINSSTGAINITSSGAGAFVVTYTTSGSCPASQTFNVNINSCTAPQPVANFSASQTNICIGDCIGFTDLSNSSATGGITSWSWTFTGATPSTFNAQTPTNICYNTAGTYQVLLTVTDANGSDTETKVSYITVSSCTAPITNFSISDSTICSGSCINFTDMSTGAASWQWSFQNGTPPTSISQNPSNICFDTAGTHEIKLVTTNTYGSDSLIKYVTVYQTQQVFVGNDTTIQLGQSVNLNATGLSSNGVYTWIPPVDLTCTTCPNPISTPEETITYTVITTDSNGCKSTDNINIIVLFENVIFVPNIFSPNGDGINDILFVRGKGVEKLKFFIYDRWGEKVFETTSLDVGWDGSFRGKEMNKAVFVYYLEATFIDGQEVTQKGDITLVK